MAEEKIGIKLRKQYNREESHDELLSRFQSKFESGSNQVIGKILGNHVFFKIPPEQKHYWSPEMDVTFEKKDEGTYVREVIGPNSNIYTLTMSLLFFTVILLFFALMFLSSQISLDMPTTTTWILIGIGIAIVILLLLFMYFGRIKAKLQILLMKDFGNSVMNSEETNSDSSG